MGLFHFLKPLITAKNFEKRSKFQKVLAQRYLDLLGSFENEIQKSPKMEFFFYSRTKENAKGLRQDLERLGYEIYGIEKSIKNQYTIRGVTPPLSLAEKEFKKWIQKMNELGFINDCNFDGWGTITHID